jgi:indole-3-glycerol phosphate synthase
MILDRILERTRRDLEQRKLERPPESLPDRHAPPPGGFREALAGPGLAVIAEIKKASPSAGIIRESFVPGELAAAYRDAGVAAISCLTDEPFFQGALEHLREAKAEAGLPFLRKDFVVDEYQIDEAVAYGADAILLIVAALTLDQLTRLRAAAEERGLDALIEAHTLEEARIALDAGATILGVNNRNLRTFEVDLGTTRDVARELDLADVVLISESGIRTTEDLKIVRGWGAHAVLVGERLMRQDDVAAAARQLVEAGRSL